MMDRLVIVTLALTDLDCESFIFPSLLLVMTLFRLSLNVATTRLILLYADAGQVITAFGDFVVGGNYVVGLIIFIILGAINFIVITKGAHVLQKLLRDLPLMVCPEDRWQLMQT
jgi:Flagellar biosynthesis pathway, component FlhA